MKKALIVVLIVLLAMQVACTSTSGVARQPSPKTPEKSGETKPKSSGDSKASEEPEPEPEIAFKEPSFNPIVISGKGDDIKVFAGVNESAIARIKGNSGSRHFAVVNYDGEGNYLDLLVNTTEPYEGIVLLDSETAEFEISATGAWEIEVRPLVTARSVAVNDSIKITDYCGRITGKNDEVIIVVSNQKSTLVTIKGNSSKRYFGVVGYGDSGWDLLVNTTEAYEGTVRLPKGDIVVLEITAIGNWEIQFD